MFDYSRPASFNGIEPEEKPHGHADMSAEEQAPTDFQSWQEYISYRYRVKNNGINKLHLEALRDPLVFLRQQLVTYSRC
jgi:hypothetical protein